MGLLLLPLLHHCINESGFNVNETTVLTFAIIFWVAIMTYKTITYDNEKALASVCQSVRWWVRNAFAIISARS